MKIHSLRLRNFRRFADKAIRFHPNFNVLIGDNASGKTTILDAVSLMVAAFFIRKSDIPVGRKTISAHEVREIIFEKEGLPWAEIQKPCVLEAVGEVEGNPVSWKRRKGDRGGEARELIQISEAKFAAVQKGEDVSMPVLLYYGTGRLWVQHRKVKIGKPESRLAGYRNCLDPRSDHYLFEKWFKQMELGAIQKRRKFDLVEGVREAVVTCIPNARNFFFDVNLDELIIEMEGEPGRILERFNNLSDGFRNMVAMVADIAHRAARLNPHLGRHAAREAGGVVLIDEINLHLHPKWQRRVVEDLKRTFPNIQFIVTTHSAFIIQSMEPGEVIDLNVEPDERISEAIQEGMEKPRDEWFEEKMAYPAPPHEYRNRSIEDIVERIMGVEIPQRSLRYQKMYETAKKYYRLLEDSETADPAEKERIKQKLDELSAPFSDDVAYHAFLEMERMAAGLEKSGLGGS